MQSIQGLAFEVSSGFGIWTWTREAEGRNLLKMQHLSINKFGIGLQCLYARVCNIY